MFRWLIGSAVSRAGEARLPTWDEFDLDAALSTVPAERMKGRVEHSVRLAPRALGISWRGTRHLSRECTRLPGTKLGLPISDLTLTKVLRHVRLGS